MKSNEKNGYVYFLKHNGLTPIKIGCTVGYSPMSRINSYSTYSPYGIELLGYIKTENPLELEKTIHYNFINNRINGEWFELSINIVSDFIYNFNKINNKDYSLINDKEKTIKDFLNTLKINSKIYNSELFDLYFDFFNPKFDINIKQILKEIKDSNINFKKDRDVLGRYLIINHL